MSDIVGLLISCYQALGPIAFVLGAFFVVLLVMLALKVWVFIMDLIPFA